MQHELVTENLSAYVEGSLEPAMAYAVENHLKECTDCFVEVRTLRQVYGWLESPAAGVEPPAGFHDDVMRRLRVADRERRLARLAVPFWRRKPALAGSGLLVAAVLAVAVLNGQGERPEGTPAGISLPIPTAPQALTVIVDGPHSTPLDIELDPARLGATAGQLKVASIANGTTQPSPGTSRPTLRVTPTAPDAVIQIVLTANGQDAATDSWTVLVSSGDGASSPPRTVLEALEAVCRTFGVGIVAPTSVLGRQLSGLPMGQTATAQLADIAGRYGLRAEPSGATWYLVRQ